MNNPISRTAVRAYEAAIEGGGDVNFVLVSLDGDDNPADVQVYTSSRDAEAHAATVVSWVIFIFEDGEPTIWKTDGPQVGTVTRSEIEAHPNKSLSPRDYLSGTRDLASRDDANDEPETSAPTEDEVVVHGFAHYVIEGDLVAFRINRTGDRDPITGTDLCYGKSPRAVAKGIRERYGCDAFETRDMPLWDKPEPEDENKREAVSRVPLPKQTILDIFEAAEHQTDYVLALHAAVVPDWDRVASLEGYVTCSPDTGAFIMGCAMEFDRANHPDVMAGGSWMNSGFSTLESHPLGDWEVSLPEITYKPVIDAALDSICGDGTAETLRAIDDVRRVVSGDDGDGS